MKRVYEQLQLLKKLIADMEEKTKDRSHFAMLGRKQRIEEARAIKAASETLVYLVKTATPEILPWEKKEDLD